MYALKGRDYTTFYWNNKRKSLVFKKKQEDSDNRKEKFDAGWQNQKSTRLGLVDFHEMKA
ncbi:hypothetical protein EI16_01005 [Hydrogenovibrio marinus]|uniref:Uncharacterized protein n=2 Tax=Hydrogenovibrio marinus TaxID=28885 RepID=A0A066ZM73_HYDMR|nr:hypothetical protein EI16_01005 [Hydrogenovibrio marinus]BBN59387.1 hypothetical protein HVMH_0981 [Hydrogenovibrio marinus]